MYIYDCKLPFTGLMLNKLLSSLLTSSIAISNYMSVLVGLDKVKLFYWTCYTAQYSKSIPFEGIYSIIFAKLRELIFIFYLINFWKINLNYNF
jgi:hypothetical protein